MIWSGRSLRSTAAVVILFASFACAFQARAAVAPAGGFIPPALADLRGFRGHIEYTAHRDSLPAAFAVTGSLIIGEHGWILVERGDRYELHADPQAASVDVDGQAIAVDDVLASDALSNPWAAALGTVASQPLDPGPANGEWSTLGLHVYVDTTGAKLVGVSEGGAHTDVAFVLDDWMKSGTLEVPGHVLRLRAGVPEAAFTLSDYHVTAAVPDRPAGYPGAPVVESAASQSGAMTIVGVDPAMLTWGEKVSAALAILLVVCVLAVAWTRRDTLVEAWCRKIARDPRGWRRAGVSVFVEPNGALAFDGMTYRVGPHFYGRAALIQCSTLFVRISAPGAPRVVILPRKFGPLDLGVKAPARRPASTGFTLIETLVATALFAAVVLGAIYPAVTAVARANAMAAERSRAVVIAANALADEEAINDYDGGAPQGSATSDSDGLILTITVSPSPMHGVSDLDVSVADANGVVLAHLASWLGAPVKAPPNSRGGPPG